MKFVMSSEQKKSEVSRFSMHSRDLTRCRFFLMLQRSLLEGLELFWGDYFNFLKIKQPTNNWGCEGIITGYWKIHWFVVLSFIELCHNKWL